MKKKYTEDQTYTKTWGSSTVWKQLSTFDDTHKIKNGPNEGERIGRKINITTDLHRYHLTSTTHFDPSGVGTHTTQQFHVRIVGFTFARESVVRTSDHTVTQTWQNPNKLLSFVARDLGDYKKFFDKTYTMSMLPISGSTTSSVYPTEIVVPIRAPRRTLEFASANTTGALGNGIISGHHELWICSDQLDMQLKVEADSLLKWTDM